MQSDFAVNKYLYTVASGWILLTLYESTQQARISTAARRKPDTTHGIQMCAPCSYTVLRESLLIHVIPTVFSHSLQHSFKVGHPRCTFRLTVRQETDEATKFFSS